MPITPGLPTEPVPVQVDGTAPPEEAGEAAILVEPFTRLNPIQVVGLVPLSIICCEAIAPYIRRMNVPIFIWSYTKNGTTVSVVTEFATLDEQDAFFNDLGWAHTDYWYYIITNDTWTWNLSYGIVPAVDYPVAVALPCPTECREWCESEFRIPVFGAGDDLYENDYNSFLVKIPRRSLTSLVTDDCTFILQKMINDNWSDLIVLNNDDYGNYYAGFEDHTDYRGVGVDWGKVYFNFGSGCYRIKLRYSFIERGEEITIDSFETPDLTTLPRDQQPVISVGMTLPPKGDIQVASFNTESEIQNSINEKGELQDAGINVVVAKGGSGLTFDVYSRKNNRVNTLLTGANPAPNDTPLPPIWTEGTYTGSSTYTQDTLYYQCFASEVFELRGWNCEMADDTVKFETWTKGKIGDKREDYLLFDLCGMWWYDSIRLYGLFGKYSVPEYKTVVLEWGNPQHGKQEKIRDEAIQAFVFTTLPLPHWLQERLSVFMMMADEIRVSDYNLINPDWNIKRLCVVGDSGFEPKTLMDKGSRKTYVEVNFKRGVQGVIKSICC